MCVTAVIGDDGEGYELRQALQAMSGVDPRWVSSHPQRRTPTYSKPMYCESSRPPRELNRLDIKNRTMLPVAAEEQVLQALDQLWPQVDGLIVSDQVSEADCGVVTGKVRKRLAQLGDAQPQKRILVDSRDSIGLFRNVLLKPNQTECIQASRVRPRRPSRAGTRMVCQNARLWFRPPCLCTSGEHGILVVDPRSPNHSTWVPAYPSTAP